MKNVVFMVFLSLFTSYAKGQIPTRIDTSKSTIKRFPVFPGGTDKLNEYLKNNLKYPKEALKNHIEGTVYMRFYVEVDGTITNIKVEDSLSTETNAEALRLVKSFPKWIPAMMTGGRPIRF
jgi:TonB family protein